MRFWRSTFAPDTTSWHAQIRLGRLQVGYHVHRHASRLGDRWVFQPFTIYDRRPA